MARFIVKSDWAGHSPGFVKNQIITSEEIRASGNSVDHWVHSGCIEPIEKQSEQTPGSTPAPRPATNDELEKLERDGEQPIQINSPDDGDEAEDAGPRRLGGKKK